jgi:hypothetical protein
MKRKHVLDEEIVIFSKKLKTDHEANSKKRKIIDENDIASSSKKIKLNNFNNFDTYRQQRRDILLYI